MKSVEVKTIQTVFPTKYDESAEDPVELHIEGVVDGERVAIIQKFTRAEWEQISKGRGYWQS